MIQKFSVTAEVFKRSEEISSMGLSVPQIARVFNILKNKGISFDEEVYTVKYAKELIIQELKKRGKI